MTDWESSIKAKNLNHFEKTVSRATVFLFTFQPRREDFSRNDFGNGIMEFFRLRKNTVLSYILAEELTCDLKPHFHMAVKLRSKVLVEKVVKDFTISGINADVSTHMKDFEDYVRYLYVPTQTKPYDRMDPDPKIHNFKLKGVMRNARSKCHRINVRGFFTLVKKRKIETEDDVLKLMQHLANLISQTGI